MSKTTDEVKKGKCLCGAVDFEVRIKSPVVTVCHCSMCRRWGGGPSLAVECAPDIIVKNPAVLKWYRSSEWAERGFCTECGSSLFYRLNENYGSFTNVAAACLEGEAEFTLDKHVFHDAKPSYYSFSDDCPRLTEADILGATK